jgi:hypothetical protein
MSHLFGERIPNFLEIAGGTTVGVGLRYLFLASLA